ncbi:hypothetical protein [Nostoc sp.]|uniref:hypothetical protein n=1 Tax=Nostoc sp. TaxID=1180 RepID=UPI002FF88C0F
MKLNTFHNRNHPLVTALLLTGTLAVAGFARTLVSDVYEGLHLCKERNGSEVRVYCIQTKSAINPSHFSRVNSPHFSDAICVDKTARYEYLRTFAQKSYVFITGFIQQFS